MFRNIVVPQNIYMADAFTEQAFSGNPTAVCVLQREASNL
jgi:predicted PhzF superfamily epimerase YddE/YHI9